MKKYIIIISLLALWGDIVLSDQIDLANNVFLQRVQNSFSHPIDVYKGHVGTLQNKVFTTRIVANVVNGQLPSLEQKYLRNQICASRIIHQFQNTAGADLDVTPAPFGFYLHNSFIYSIHSLMYTKMTLAQGLRLLQKEKEDIKLGVASFYYAKMRNVLHLLHRSGIIVNDVSLHNFYISSDGYGFGIDVIDYSSAMSTAVHAPALAADLETPDKIANRKALLETAIDMYKILFPDMVGQASSAMTMANRELAPVVATAYAINPGNWHTTDVATAVAGGNEAFKYNIREDIRDLISAGRLVRANHTSTQGNPGNAGFLGNNGFAVDTNLLALLINPVTNAPYPRLDSPTAAEPQSLCSTWTGRE